METTSPDGGLSGLMCDVCGVGNAEIAALSRHIDHLGSEIDLDANRRLRAHVFALLAAASHDGGATGDANEYPLLKTAAAETGSLTA